MSTPVLDQLPEEIKKHLPGGFCPQAGCWLVLPSSDEVRDGIATVNSWLRAEDWYPMALDNIVWFGDDGVGNLFGWDPEKSQAILWNPEDGESPWKVGSIEQLWQFVMNDYADAT